MTANGSILTKGFVLAGEMIDEEAWRVVKWKRENGGRVRYDVKISSISCVFT